MLDRNKPFWVVRVGGSIGEVAKDGLTDKRGNLIVATFDSKEEAKELAKRRRKGLSVGERKYYKMTYRVVTA